MRHSVTVSGLLIAAATRTSMAVCPAPALDHGVHATTATLVVDGPNALRAALADANAGAGTQIIIRPGTYELDAALIVTRRGLTVRGESGQRDDVVLRGRGPAGATSHVFVVEAADFTLADLSVGWVRNHAVQVRGELDADRPRFSNIRFANTGEQLLKVSGARALEPSSDQGVVEASLFEHTSGVAHSWYTAGIDVHRGQGWIVRDNVFRGIRSPESRLAEHAIHFWTNAAHTVVERNIITESDRGIGFGLGERGHEGGIIRNNFVSVGRDVGIGLENARGVLVAHNTVIVKDYPNAIEYRFKGTRDGRIANNLTNGAITSRDGGQALETGNVTGATNQWFRQARTGDLHLADARPGLVDAVGVLPQVTVDVDCEPRPLGRSADVGADESGQEVDEALPAVSGTSGWLGQLSRNVGHVASMAGTRIAASPILMAVTAGSLLAVIVMVFLVMRLLHIREPGQATRSRRRRSGSPEHPAIHDVHRPD